ncbi:MAG: dephospho-CoA kinase [Lachnospiraceae bacterium]|jgi:dephospho-CoA kinase|nr:dephospho-CoA kinase [Lachnospiraceae bacterium]
MHQKPTDDFTLPDNGLVIGVTGGIGAGKSQVLNLLKEEYGAHILLADQVAAQLEEPGYEGFYLLVNRFGRNILGEEGRLDRKAFADMIFKEPEILNEVNEMLHPLTWQVLCKKVDQLRSLPGGPHLVVVEAALFDENSKKLCDTLWYVDASEEKRLSRLMENRGYSQRKCQDIMRNQLCREEFLLLADQVIDNNGSIEEVRVQIARLLGSPCPVSRASKA